MTTSSSAWRKLFGDEVRRLQEDAVYTYKGHFNQAENWERRHFWLGIPAAALAVVASATVIPFPALATMGLAFASALLTAALVVVNPADRASKSRAAADAWQAQHVRLRQWVELDLPRLSEGPARAAISGFGKDKARLNKAAPGIGRAAQRRAQRGVALGEADHVVDGAPHA